MGATALRARGLFAASVLALHANSCGRVGYDLLASRDGGRLETAGAPTAGGGAPDLDASGASGRSGGGGAASAGGTVGAGGNATAGTTGSGGVASASGGSGATGSGGEGGAGGTTTADGGPLGDASPSGDSGAPDARGTACGPSTGILQTWSFDSQTQGWAWSASAGTGALGWTSAMGNPNAGALATDLQTGTGLLGWLTYYIPRTDLRGQIASAWVWLDAGTDAGVKLYMQSDTPAYDWADGGFVPLTPGTWTCLTLNVDVPDYVTATFDPSIITRFGIEIAGTAPFHLYVDELTF